MRPILFIALILSVSSTVANDAYTWIDKRGVRHFSDRPPDLQQTGSYALRSAPSPGPNQARMDNQAQRAAAEQRRFEEALRRDAEKEEQARKQRCLGLTEQLSLLERRAKLRTTDTDGKHQMLDETERQALIRDTRLRLQISCAY